MSDARERAEALAPDRPSFVSGLRTVPASAAVERLRAGDPEALGAFFQRYRRGLAAYFGRMHWDWSMVPDLVQETITRAIAAMPSFRGEAIGQAAHWLFAIARHVHLQEVSRQVGIRLRQDVAVQMAACMPSSHDGGCDLRDLVAALEELPLSQLEVLRLLLEGLRPAEIATRLDLPEGTVAIRLHRARKRLHARLEADDDEPTTIRRRC